MKRTVALRQRLTIAISVYVVLLSLTVFTHGYIVNERAERLVWESLLESELALFLARREDDPEHRWTDTESLRLFGSTSGRPIPPEFSSLGLGVHDEIRVGDSEFIVFVEGSARDPMVLALEISDIERRERDLTMVMAVSSAVVAVLLALITHLGAGMLVRPLTSIARSIESLSPDRSGQSVEVERSAPTEVVVIGTALNAYLQRIDRFVERERAFINMASHELRTPIAVISGSAEVALDRVPSSDPVKPHLEQILHTVHDMENLIALLLALAKDPARLRAANDTVDLAELVPAIVRDHLFLTVGKELEIEVGPLASRYVHAPLRVVRAAIGNLVRNAIENSDRGVINVSISDRSEVVVRDPGHGMSHEEMSRIYAGLARSGRLSRGGIGIDLISRLCEHLGWNLTFSSHLGEGTTATLAFHSPPSTEIRDLPHGELPGAQTTF